MGSGRMLGSLAAAVAGSALLVVGCSSDDGREASDEVTEEPASDAGTEAEDPGGEGSEEVAFPGDEWEPADPAELGFDPDALEQLAGEAERQGSECLMVVRDGKVVGEWSWNDFGDSGTREVFSATKSYTSTLVGLAQAEGLLDIDDPASDYIEEWAGTEAEDVTIRNLLSNDSGRQLDPELEYGDQGLGRAEDQNEFAIGLEQEAAPGTTWGYNNAAIQTLDAVLQEATGQDTADYAREKLLDPLGMTSSEMTRDQAGNTLTYMGLQSSCQEMARYGHLFGQGGHWDGTQVVPEDWVTEATGQPSQDLNAAYGFLWWLNRPGPVTDSRSALEARSADEIDEGQLVEDAPEDMYFALGLQGQIIAVDPGSGTVVVRLGGGDEFGAQEAADLVTKTQLAG